jgi:hypothetical protein
MNLVPPVPFSTPTSRRWSGLLLAAAAAAFCALGAPSSPAQSFTAPIGAAQPQTGAAQDGAAPKTGAVQADPAQTGAAPSASASPAPSASAQPSPGSSAQAWPALAEAPPDDAASLLGRVRTISFEAKLVTLADGSKWIKNSVDVETVLPGRLDDLIELLCDYRDSPKVFSRVATVQVRSTEGDVAVTEQKSVVKALGFQYSSTLVLRNVLERLSPTSARLSFAMIGGDGSCRSSSGGWNLKELELGSGPAVFVEYHTDMLVRPDFPMQLQIMQLFGKGDFEHMMRELEKAFAARNAGR